MTAISDFFTWATKERRVTLKHLAGEHDQSTHGGGASHANKASEYSIREQGAEVEIGGQKYSTGKVLSINDNDRKLMGKKKMAYSIPEAVAMSSVGSVKDGKPRFISVTTTSQSNGGRPNISFDPPPIGSSFYMVSGDKAQAYTPKYE